jgi:MoaA/NifB/PqqE/SkfB family radical SAM enzyme
MTPLHQKVNLFRGLLTGHKAYSKPFYLTIDATHRCNLHCAYCRWHSQLLPATFLNKNLESDLSPELFRQLCADLSGTGTQTLQFVGAGEPLLHPQIYDMISTAKSFGFRVLLYSNGVLLDDSTIRMLIAARLDLLRVTLGDTSAEGFEQKHPQIKLGAFQRILDGLNQFSGIKREQGLTTPQLELGVPIDRNILADLDTIIKIAATTGCNGLFFSVVLDFGQDALKHFCLSPEEVDTACRVLPKKRKLLETLSIRHNIDEVLLRYQIGRNVWKRVPCYGAWYFSFIRSDGQVMVCQRSQIPMGDLKQNSFGEIWNCEAYQNFRRSALLDRNPPYDCEFCPHVINNHRVYSYLRWLHPLLMICRR